jgi:hypothetical protein
MDAYRMTRITAHQLCRVLDIPSRYELDGFLRQHGVPLEYSLADFGEEAARQCAPLAEAAGQTLI